MARGAVDKWKAKKWFEIVAPSMFNERVIGETFTTTPKNLAGRVIETGLDAVTGEFNPRLQKTKLKFRVKDVSGGRATTIFLGHRIAQDFERSLVRRRTTKVYINQVVETKDNVKVRIKSFLVTTRQVNVARQKLMRQQYRDFLAAEAKKQNLGEFINNILFNRIGGKCKRVMSKVYPIRHAIIQKTEMVGEKYVPAVAAAKVEEKPAEEPKAEEELAEAPKEEPKAEVPEETAEPEPVEEEPEAEEK